MFQDSKGIDGITFPVIAFGKGSVIHFSRSIDELTTCSSVSFRKGYFNDLTLVDSNAIKLRVKKAIKVGTVGPLWGFSLVRGRTLRVKFDVLEKGEFVDLDKFKEMILTVFEKDQFFWDSDGYLERRKNFVQNASTYSEILNQLTEDFYKTP